MRRIRVSLRLGVLVCVAVCDVPATRAQSLLNAEFPKPNFRAASGGGQKFNASSTDERQFSAPGDLAHRCGVANGVGPQSGTWQQDRGGNVPSPSLEDMDERLDVNWHRLPKNFVEDQKDMWLFPLKVGEGHHIVPTLAVTGTTAGLIAADPNIEGSIRRTDVFQDTNDALNAKVSGGIIAGVPSAFYLVGLLRHDNYDQATSLFAGEAVADDTILMIVIKAITRRERPADRPLAGPYNDTFFKSNAGPLGKGSSFPSGHAMMGFSVATVFARRYREHKWVPWVAYGVAGILSFSRITTGAHFPSEVFIGGALGYAIARFDVLHGN